jgi:hypothetical protein
MLSFVKKAIASHRPQVAIVGIQTFGRLAHGALGLGLLQFRCNCTNYTRRHPVLKLEDIFEDAVKMVRPTDAARRGVDAQGLVGNQTGRLVPIAANSSQCQCLLGPARERTISEEDEQKWQASLAGSTSALGHSRRSRDVRPRSGLPPTADISRPDRHFAFGPIAIDAIEDRLYA